MNTAISRGQLLIISAPSGAGKTSLIRALSRAVIVVSRCLSRTRRGLSARGEVEGVNYFFVPPETFQRHARATAHFSNGPKYSDIAMAPARRNWTRAFQQGADVILEIDWQGAQQVRSLLPDSAWIFILPPSVGVPQDAIARIGGRILTPPLISACRRPRMKCRTADEADYLVINDAFDTALVELQAIISAARLRTGRQQAAHTAPC